MILDFACCDFLAVYIHRKSIVGMDYCGVLMRELIGFHSEFPCRQIMRAFEGQQQMRFTLSSADIWSEHDLKRSISSEVFWV